MKKLFSFEIAQKAQRFLDCKNLEDLRFLGFDVNHVIYDALHPYYYTFEIRKSSGGMRTVEAPGDGLKATQKQFNFYLQCLYYTLQHPASHGYIIRAKDQPHNKNILGNARQHLGAKYMMNADFQDFFHQISEQRVFHLLQYPPFRFHKKTAHTLSKIFTYKKRLPMGAPTSPVLSNLLSLELDEALYQWANEQGITYTRFVDDLTFSSKEEVLTEAHLKAVRAICAKHLFRLNPKKTKYYGAEDTKKVTGLVLNETVDIEQAFYDELDIDLKRLQYVAEVGMIVNKHNEDDTLKEFKQQVEGQINFIGMIEGYNSPIFYKYRKRMAKALKPDPDTLSARWTNFNYL